MPGISWGRPSLVVSLNSSPILEFSTALHPVILGLTGSLGSGKSTVARLLEEIGEAKVIDADAIVHELQSPGQEVYDRIVEAFGRSCILPDGSLDRKRIAEVVFRDESKRLLLNHIVHPAVRERELELLQEFRGHPLVVLMVPLLFEVGMDSLVDQVLVVTVDENARLNRLSARSGMSADEAARRLAAQMSQAEKAARADHLIDNSGSLEETRTQVTELLEKLGVLPVKHRGQRPA